MDIIEKIKSNSKAPFAIFIGVLIVFGAYYLFSPSEKPMEFLLSILIALILAVSMATNIFQGEPRRLSLLEILKLITPEEQAKYGLSQKTNLYKTSIFTSNSDGQTAVLYIADEEILVFKLYVLSDWKERMGSVIIDMNLLEVLPPHTARNMFSRSHKVNTLRTANQVAGQMANLEKMKENIINERENILDKDGD